MSLLSCALEREIGITGSHSINLTVNLYIFITVYFAKKCISQSPGLTAEAFYRVLAFRPVSVTISNSNSLFVCTIAC